MFKNLEIEMLRAGVNKGTMAHELGIAPCTMSSKFTRKTEWTLAEMLNIKHGILHTDVELEELFKWEI